MKISTLFILSFLLIACHSARKEEPMPQKKDQNIWTATLKQLNSSEYPDNPDWEIRHSDYDQIQYSELHIRKDADRKFTLRVQPGNRRSDTIQIPAISLMEFIPNAPDFILEDDYITLIGLVNQEFNHHEVCFEPEQYRISGGRERFNINRVDLAQNCLNAYRWELIIYAEDADGETKPYYHAWFDFPKDLYAELFNQRNPGLDYETFRKSLENRIDMESKAFDLNKLRTVVEEKELAFQSLNKAFYPLLGERKKKAKNILVPHNTTAIEDFLNDSTLFATFSSPGIYERKNPKTTQLSRFAKVEKVYARKTKANNKDNTDCLELEYVFRRSTDNSLMRMIVGGVRPDKLHHLPLADAYKGWQMPMGIGNHSFYEHYEVQQSEPAAENPYFAVLLDEKGNWLDSHIIGIDGPLFHLDSKNPTLLHLWVLSFERHAFVGHITCDLSDWLKTPVN